MMNIDPSSATGSNKLATLLAKMQSSVIVVDTFGGRKFSYAGVSVFTEMEKG